MKPAPWRTSNTNRSDAAVDADNCATFVENVKHRHAGDLFYPDVLVPCEEHRPGREWVEAPVLLAEVPRDVYRRAPLSLG